MSKYDKYRVQQPQDLSTSKYAKYRVMPSKQESPSFLDRAKQLGSGLLSGFARSALEEGGNQAKYGVMEVGPGIVVPISESSAMANIPEKGIKALDSLKPIENDSLGKILHHAGEFGGGMASFPMLPGRAVSTGAKSLLSRFAKDVGTGSAIGAGSGMLQEGGVNPLAADLISSIATPNLPSALKGAAKQTGTLAAKIPMKLMGLSPKGLNIETAQAARDLGIDLPAAVLTNSKLTGLADQYVGKAPFFGEMIGKKYTNAEAQTKNALEKIYNQVGPEKTPEIDGLISKMYEERTKTLPKGASVKPINLKKAIDKINIDSALLSPDEKSLLDSLEKLKNEIEPQLKLASQFGQIKMPLQDFDINRLIGTKTSLNNIIKWGKDEGVKNQLRNVQHALTQDIAEYGKTNPEWYKTFKEADKLYGDVAKRGKLEDLLGVKSTNHATESLSYNALSKAINNPKNAESIKRQLTKETFEKIQKLGTVAKAMAIKNKNIPNPSGTATTAATTAVIYGMFTNPLKTIPTLGAGYGITKLLTDKKFLDLALKYAENPSKSNLLTTMALKNRIKEVTGVSAITLQNALERQNRSKGDE